MTAWQHVMTAEDIEAFVKRVFPQALAFAGVVRIGEGELTIQLGHDPDGSHLRPGGTISGPVLMTMADTAFYFLILSLIGPVALTVTTNLNIDFLRRPPAGAITATARMLKLGKRLASGDVFIHHPDVDGPVARASVTYSIPPPDKRSLGAKS